MEGLTERATIRKFVVAGQFIDVLNAFETGMSEDVSLASGPKPADIR